MDDLIKESFSIAQVAKKFFGYDNGHSRTKVKKYIEDNQVDISHFSHKRKIERIIKTCPVCGENFETKVNHRDEKITCSHSCSNSYFRSGKNNPNWKNDSYRTTCWMYHQKKCVICDESKIVTVHHYDENHENNLPENLVPLCPTHHQYVHSRFRNLVIDKINDYVYNFKNNSLKF